MSTPQPERRRSALAGRTPVTPPAQSAPVADKTPEAPAVPVEPAATKKPARTKIGFYTDKDQAERYRAAFWNTMVIEGDSTSFGDFVDQAVLEKVRRLEAQYNDGEPWPGRGPGEVPTGRAAGGH